jgi:hypothetical protein
MNSKHEKQSTLEKTLQQLLELSKLQASNVKNEDLQNDCSKNPIFDEDITSDNNETLNPKFPVDATVKAKLLQLERDNPLIPGFNFIGNQRIQINDMPYEFFKGNEAPGREYFRCLGCRQYRDELSKKRYFG